MSKKYISLAIISVSLFSCASVPAVKTQDYADLPNSRIFEYEFPKVWKGIENTVKNFKIVEVDPAEVSANEWKELSERSLETDWIYAQSRDKYIEYKINDSPRKKYLQTRLKYEIEARRVLGGVEVEIFTIEEVERLDSDGNPIAYEKSEYPDTSRANELLEKINISLLGL